MLPEYFTFRNYVIVGIIVFLIGTTPLWTRRNGWKEKIYLTFLIIGSLLWPIAVPFATGNVISYVAIRSSSPARHREKEEEVV